MFLQLGASKSFNSTGLGDIEDLIHNFLIIMLEHSMRQKDGWKVISVNLRHSLLLFIINRLLHILSSLLCIIIMMFIPCCTSGSALESARWRVKLWVYNDVDIPCFVLWSVAHTLFSAFDWMAALEPCFYYQFEI